MARIERKFCATAEIRAEAAASDGLVSGYASTFEAPEDHDWYGDVIAPGAFADTLAERGPASEDPSIVMLWEHSSPFGVPTKMIEDDRGLYTEGRPSATTENSDRMIYISDRVVRGLSIGFRPLAVEELDVQTRWGYPVRRILKADLVEYSPTYSPANPFAQIDPAKSYDWRRQDDGMWVPTGERTRTVVGVKAGKVLSAKNLKLVTEARDALDGLIAAATEDDDSKSASDALREFDRQLAGLCMDRQISDLG